MASHVIAEAERQAPRAEKVLNNFKTGALQAAKVLGRASLRIGIRAATAGLIEGEAFEEAAADITKAFGEEATKVLDEALKARLESHESDRKVFENFRATLGQLAVALSRQQQEDTSDLHALPASTESARPLVFIVDELDRCRPTFALELLEKIKHFFSVPGVIFLLVSSLSQLEMAVRFAYGEVDAHTYLEKFYHLRVLLPVGGLHKPDLTAATYLRHIGCNRNVAEIVDEFSRVYPLSLRTLERIVTYSKIIEASIPKNGLLVPQIIAVLCVIKVLNPSSINQFGDRRRRLGRSTISCTSAVGVVNITPPKGRG